MSTRGHRSQTPHTQPQWSLFPPALNIPGSPVVSRNEMNHLHKTRQLSPIPQSDETESDYSGADVRDIPFYRPSRASLDKQFNNQHEQRDSGMIHEFEALVAHSPAPLPLGAHPVNVPSRSSSKDKMENRTERPQSFELMGEDNMKKYDVLEPLERPELPYGEKLERPDSRKSSRLAMPFVLQSRVQSPSTAGSRSVSRQSERTSYQTDVTSLAPLQTKGLNEHDQLEPLNEEDLDPGSFDLVAPVDTGIRQYSLENRSELLFSKEHLKIIFDDPSLLLRFTNFLSATRQSSIPILIYYLDAIKALRAISYSNAIAEALDPIAGFDFTSNFSAKTVNNELEEKARQAFDVLVQEDLPAFVTQTYIETVSLSIQRRITGTLPSHLREASEGLAEVFCLTDPSRPDNPIVFASEQFHRTTQYGMSHVIGHNCRFLQGPKTNPFSVRRIREMIDAGKEHCEVFLNYRRDGSPFMNLLMIAPLCDSRGTIRYFIGAQVDVSGLVKECSDMESLRRLAVKVEDAECGEEYEEKSDEKPTKDKFQELSEMLNLQELDTVRRWGGRMHKQHEEESQENGYRGGNWSKPRLVINSCSPDGSKGQHLGPMGKNSGRLSGIYENYLLVRPYPSLRVLFASPSLRVPGILQSPFMAKIGGSNRVREELTQALADGRGVTAKVKWVSKTDLEGRNRWIHCTPLLGNNGAIGVWMIVIVDDEHSQTAGKRYKVAPPVDPKFGRSIPAHHYDDGSLRDFALMNGGRDVEGSIRQGSIGSHDDTHRSGSPYNPRVDSLVNLTTQELH